jgi:hypothetical protein
MHAILFGSLWAAPAFAEGFGGLPFDPGQFQDPSRLTSVADSIVSSVGLIVDHRAYEPATPLGTNLGFDAGIEVTLVKVPDRLFDTLRSVGMNSGIESIPSLPVPRFNVHKGWGESMDIGLAAIWYQGYRIISGDIKVVLARPEEGLTWALRFSYTTSTLGFVTTNTYTPQLVASRKLDWADPYLGLAYQVIRGKISFDYAPTPLPPQHFEAFGKGSGEYAFLGVGMKVPGLGFKLTVEGSYNGAGASTLGTKFGLSF